ncbi:hypothetical protein HBA54_04310 [Pelagibius litoralis]|uniref:Uncharacterized protein n=1 Tax=Pelagibius litoralis TaxID=374515 RepID=A0A967EUW6_9PROT|nr:hypothetical protein [Pelagibius litoralis]NIA67806.1 hypothetical protein [Pelagibius litoralis]
MTYQGYEFEKTAPRRWYVTSKKFGNVCGPFKTRKGALEYIAKIDA